MRPSPAPTSNTRIGIRTPPPPTPPPVAFACGNRSGGNDDDDDDDDDVDVVVVAFKCPPAVTFSALLSSVCACDVDNTCI
jgi:hypothetical protein